jgi:hypothetical protein
MYPLNGKKNDDWIYIRFLKEKAEERKTDRQNVSRQIRTVRFECSSRGNI